MILQLKITLKGFKPPIWRRIQVESNISFHTLHSYIQTAFDWHDMHLHEFQLKSSTTNKLMPFNPVNIAIGPITEFSKPRLKDEESKIVGDYLQDEKEKLLYIYDFGDEWVHEVVLEKILDTEDNVSYPRCLKARRVAPEEDSRSLLEDDSDGAFGADLSDKELTEEINIMFDDFQVGLNNTNEYWGYLFELVDRFYKIKPWEHFVDDQLLIVDLPDFDTQVYCTVLGNANEEYGLAVYIGPEGLDNIIQTFTDPDAYEKTGVLKQHSLLLSFSNKDELSEEDLNLIQSLGLNYQGENAWPLFRNLTPGYYPWFFDSADIIMLAQVLELTLDIYADGNPDAIPPFPEKHWARLAYDSKIEAWKYDFSIPEATQAKTFKKQALQISEIEIQRTLKQFKKKNVVIEFAVNLMPEPTQNEEGGRPFFPKLITAINHQTGEVLWSEIYSPDDFEGYIQSSILELSQQLGGIPREVWINDKELLSWTEVVFKKLKMKIMAVEKLPATTVFLDHMYDHFK